MASPAPFNEAWATYAQQLGVNLQRLRLERKLSQERVAYMSGLSRYTYQKYERGESRPGMPANPTISSLLAISQALEVSLADVLPATIPDLLAR